MDNKKATKSKPSEYSHSDSFNDEDEKINYRRVSYEITIELLYLIIWHISLVP